MGTKTLGSLRQLKLKRVKSAGSVTVGNNTNLRNLEGLENLELVEAGIGIGPNGDGFSLRGFAVKRALGTQFREGIGISGPLSSLDELSSLREATQISLYSVLGLKDLTGLDGLASLSKLYVTDCPDLEDISGLNSVVRMWSSGNGDSAGELQVGGNPKLKTITGFQGLKEAQSIFIGENPVLDECKVRQKFNRVSTLSLRIQENGPCQ